MDREQFREQITQRYVAGKALDGASSDEIAKGMVDPVEQMNYVTGLGADKSAAGSGSSSGGVAVLFILLLVIVLSGLAYLIR